MDPDDAFPFKDYRPHQRELLQEAAGWLFETAGVDNVIIDAPTGVGKSPVNVALGRLSESAFYTTPQKGLRRQLEADEALKPYHSVVRARDDYTCNYPDAEDVSCRECKVANDPDEGCYRHPCPYWDAKEEAMDSRVATLTFSYLIVDNFLPNTTPVTDEDGTEYQLQVSFDDRDLLIVDEAHALETQVASLHAGFTLSERTLKSTQTGYRKQFYQEYRRSADVAESPLTTSEILVELRTFTENLEADVAQMRASAAAMTEKVKKLSGLVRKLEHCISETEEGLPWVVSPETPPADADEFQIQVQPVWVDRFLQEYVWSRADKRVLSTATMPYRDEPERWMERLGLAPSRTEVISKPMPFPAESRPVHTRGMIERFTSGRDRDSEIEQRVVDALGWILKTHPGEKGLIHSVSYQRAERYYDYFQANAVLHRRDESTEEVVKRWQGSDAAMLFSPSMMEGVDLEGDMCRWQALAKVPYASLGDNRASYLLYEEQDERWYNENAARKIVQAVGRGVRSPDDYCDFYVLDESFVDVRAEAAFPEWFNAAIEE